MSIAKKVLEIAGDGAWHKVKEFDSGTIRQMLGTASFTLKNIGVSSVVVGFNMITGDTVGYKVDTVEVDAAGTGYAKDDKLMVGDKIVATVATVGENDGEVLTITEVDTEVFATTPAGTGLATTTDGGGTGCTLNLTASAIAEDTTLDAGATLEITADKLSGKSLYVKCDALGLIEYAPTLS
jgi:hypothetical protein